MPEILRQPVNDASVWEAAHVRDAEAWTLRLDDSQKADIDAALKGWAAGGHAPTGFSPDDFPLPSLDGPLADMREHLQDGRGFALIRGLPAERYTLDQLTAIYWGVGQRFGEVISQNTQGDLIGRVTDHGDEFSGDDPYASGIRAHRTRVEIHPHCDSSDLVGLLCVRPALRGGRSFVVSSTALYNEILATRPEFLNPLCRGFHIDLVGKGTADDQISNRRIPVFSYFGGKLSCRFNKRQIELGAEKAGHPLNAEEQAAVDYVRELSVNPQFQVPMDFQPGDMQFLNNHVTLHARDGYEDAPDPASRRLLLRMWINVPNGRPLAPELADRLNTGPRGGVTRRAS